MQVHGIHGCRLVYQEVVEALSNYKKSYFWWYVNPACGDSTGSKWIEKDQACVSPRPVWGKRGEGAVWFSVCGAPLDIGLMVVMLMFYSRVVSVVLVLLWVGPFLRSRYGIEWQKVCCIVSVNEMSAEWHSRNLILATDCFRIVTLIA